jgi:signal-transduction protein with cAMP-binding, CBS, and nucleotidyltransferase domain
MEKVSQIIARKQPHFKKISPACSIRDALSRMSTQHTDYLIVMDDDENFLGLLTEHDVASKTVFAKRSLSKTSVNEIMHTNMPLADRDDTVEQCMRTMKRHHVRHLPVFDKLNFLGIISADDILDEAVNNRAGIFD